MKNIEFERVINLTKETVFIAIKKYLNRNLQHHIDDVFQNVYLKIFERFKTIAFDEINSIKDYLFIMTKNECFKINKKEQKLISLFDEKSFILNKTESIFTDLKEIIISLPHKYQEITKLFYLENFPIEDISFYLKLSQNTIKTRLFRSREKIKKIAQKRGIL